MKIGKQFKIMLSGLIVIQLFCLSVPPSEVMASAVLSDNDGGASAGNTGQTEVSARIVAEDPEQEDPSQSDGTDGKTDNTGETDSTGATAKVENTVRTGDDLSAAILPICVTAISGAAIILFLRVKKRKNPCFH